MKENEEIVKLVDVKELDNDMKKIEEYCKFIDKTLRKLSIKEEIYLKDLEKCIDRVDRIRSYAIYKLSGNDHLALTSFLYDENE